MAGAKMANDARQEFLGRSDRFHAKNPVSRTTPSLRILLPLFQFKLMPSEELAFIRYVC